MAAVLRCGTGAAAAVVLVVTGAWVRGPGDVDAELWREVRPVIEARLVADAHGTGYGEDVPGLDARWFCRARALDLDETGGVVRAGVDTLCVAYGVRAGALAECAGARVPQVLRLRRDASGGYRVLSREEPPDGAGYARWEADHFGALAGSALDGALAAAPLEAAARARFALPADAPVTEC